MNANDTLFKAFLHQSFAHTVTKPTQASLDDVVEADVSVSKLREIYYTPSQLKGWGNFTILSLLSIVAMGCRLPSTLCKSKPTVISM